MCVTNMIRFLVVLLMVVAFMDCTDGGWDFAESDKKSYTQSEGVSNGTRTQSRVTTEKDGNEALELSSATRSTSPSSTHPSSTPPSSTQPSSTHPSSTHPSSTHPSSTQPSSTHPRSTHPNSTTVDPQPSSTEKVPSSKLENTTTEPRDRVPGTAGSEGDDNSSTTTEETVTPTPTDEEDDVIDDAVHSEFVHLVDNRYQGVVVHIGDEVPFSEFLLRNIEKLFNDSQKLLEFATRPQKTEYGGLTFGNVIISVPSNWEKDYPAPPISLGSPAMRVEPPNPSYGHVPYTLQPGGCEEQGTYIHLTPEYVNNMFNETVKKLIGSAESVLVHEWAHFRWGVFDEYVSSDILAHPHLSLAKPFYLNDIGQVIPSVCPKGIVGHIIEEVHEESYVTPSTNLEHSSSNDDYERSAEIRNSSPSFKLCESFTPEGLPSSHCSFYSDPSQTTKGSLMGYFSDSHLSSNGKRFCGNGVVPHDPAAPTPHNLRCGGRSVWEVMKEHDDFASHCGHPQTNNAIKQPTFTIYKRQNPKALLVILDCFQLSNSKLPFIKHDLLRFFEIFVPKNLKYKRVTSQSLSQSPESLSCDVGGTDQAVLEATSWLERLSLSHTLVVTLHSSSNRSLIDRLYPTLPNNSALHTVNLGLACPDKSLKKKERKYPCTEHSNGDDLSDTLRQVLTSHSTQEDQTQVYAQSHPLNLGLVSRTGGKTSVSGNFFLNFCQGSSIISVLVPNLVLDINSLSIDMTLVHDGKETPLSLYEQKLYKGADNVRMILTVPCEEAYGDWEYVIRTRKSVPSVVQKQSAQTELMVDVKVYQHEDENTAVKINTFILVKKRLPRICPIYDGVKTDIATERPSVPLKEMPRSPPRPKRSLNLDEDSEEQPKKEWRGTTISYNDSLVRIVSVLTQGSKGEETPILGATVTAFVSREGSPALLQVPLLDSGIGADEVPDDGIYSSFLTVIPGNGRYVLSVEAKEKSSSRRRISTTRRTFFWDQQRQKEQSVSPNTRDVYLLKVRCFGVHPSDTLQVQQQPDDPGVAALDLTVLEKELTGSSQGKMYSGKANITQSGKLLVPPGCTVVNVVSQGDLAPDSSTYASPASFAPVRHTVNIPNGTFSSESNDTFTRHRPTPEEEEEEEEGLKDGGGEESFAKGKDAPELTVGVSKFRVKRAVRELEVVEYSSRDLYPPGRVRNLTVIKMHYTRPAVTLQWSCPGDDMYTGTAHRIDLRYHRNQELLRVEFQSATPVQENKHVAFGALKPLPADHTQTVVIILNELSLDDLEEDVTLHFGMIVWDESDNAGGLSNLAEARFTVTEKKKELKDLESSKTLLCIAFAVLLVALGVVLVLVCCAKIKAYLQKRKDADNYNVSYYDLTTTTKWGTHPRNRSRNLKQDGGRPKQDGVPQNNSLSGYCSREPKGKLVNGNGTN